MAARLIFCDGCRIGDVAFEALGDLGAVAGEGHVLGAYAVGATVDADESDFEVAGQWRFPSSPLPGSSSPVYVIAP